MTMITRVRVPFVSVLAFVAALHIGCGSDADRPPAGHDAGTAVLDASITVLDYAVSKDGAKALVFTQTVAPYERFQLREVDLTTMLSRQLVALPDLSPRRAFQWDTAGNVYYVRSGAVPQVARVTPSDAVVTESTVTRFGGDLSCDVAYIVSPDGAYFGLCDASGASLLHGGKSTALPNGTEVLAFSPDSSEALLSDFTILSLGSGRVRDVALSHAVAGKVTVRWDDAGLSTLTSDGQDLYVDDVLNAQSRKLWPVQSDTYAWADGSHVFEASVTCVDRGFLFGDCSKYVADLAYRAVDDGAARQVAETNASVISGATLLPDGHRFVWLADGTLWLQTMQP